MTALEELPALTQAAFGSLFLLTIVDFIRWRDRIRLEIALLFGAIGVPVLIQALDAGCDAYVAKPIDTRTFANFDAQFLPRAAEAIE